MARLLLNGSKDFIRCLVDVICFSRTNIYVNIIYFNNIYKPVASGGTELLVSYLAEEMSSRGNEVTVITTSPPLGDDHLIDEPVNNVRVIRFFPTNIYWSHDGVKRSMLQKAIWHGRDMWNLNAANMCRKLLSDIRPDIVHTHNIDGFSPSIWREVARKGIPLVHTAHDSHQLCVRSTLLKRNGEICGQPSILCQLYREWYKRQSFRLDAFCAPSEFTLKLYQQNHFRARSFHVVRNGVPSIHLHSSCNSTESDRKKDIVKFLFIGRLESAKGIQVLLNAFERLGSGIPAELNIAGVGEHESLVLQACASDTRIKYHGFVGGIEKEMLFVNANFLIFPSASYETFGLGIIEAYSVGLPVIVSDFSAPPELVEEGVTGFLFPSGNADALASIMRLCINSPLISTAMKDACKIKSGLFSVKKMADDYTHIYYKLLS